MYRVINTFKDKDGHLYETGKPYPAEGKKLDEKRADYLTQVHQTYKVAFLEKETPTEPPKKKVAKKKSDA